MIGPMQSFFLDKRNWVVFFLIVIGLIASILIAPVVPPAIDWRDVFRPATLEALKGHSPYKIDGYFYPPWAVLPLIPFALLPEAVGRVLLIVVALVAFAYTADKLHASKIATIALLLSPLVLHEVLNGNIDWLAVLGIILPPWLGLFFIVIKPQMAIGVIIFWLFFAWKEGGIKKVIKTFAPVTIAYGLSMIVFGLWPFAAVNRALVIWWNASLWPVSIPLGLTLLVTAIRKNDIRYAMGASPCLSPYVLFHSWVIVLLAIVTSTPEIVMAVIGLWILVIIRGVGG
jgi:hypothetical protein